MTTAPKILSALAVATALVATGQPSRAEQPLFPASERPEEPTGINPEPSPADALSLPSEPREDVKLPSLDPASRDTVAPPPSSPTPASGATRAGTTSLTSAEYDAQVGAERPSWSPNKPMLGVGSALFVGSYGASVIVGAASGNDADKQLFIPVAGPWLDMGERTCGFGQCTAMDDFDNALLVASGLTQVVGVGLVVASMFVPDASSRRVAKAPPAPEVHVLPTTFGSAGAGLGAVGTF